MAEVFTTVIASNIPDVIRADQIGLVKAARKVVGGRARWLRTTIGNAIRRAGLGDRFAGLIRNSAVDTPDGVVAETWSKAKIKRPTGLYDLAVLFQSDQDIRANEITVQGRIFMAIPLPAAGQRRGRAAAPMDYARDSLIAHVHADWSAGVLAFKDDPATPAWILVRRVHIRRRLDLDETKRKAMDDIQGRILREWARHRGAIALRLYT